MDVNAGEGSTLQIETWDRAIKIDQMKMFVYGEADAGKTVFASTWPDPIFLDADRGMMSVSRQVARIEISDWSQLGEAFLYLERSNHPYKTVVLDTLNEMQHLCLVNTVRSYPRVKRPYDEMASESDYGKMLFDFGRMIRTFRSLPLNVLMLGHVRRREYPDEPVMPQLIGRNTAVEVCRKMDVIGYLEVTEKNQQLDRRMVFGSGTVICGDKTGKLPSQVANPTWSILYEFWRKP